jgi:uncharacterized membrane protein YwzB
MLTSSRVTLLYMAVSMNRANDQRMLKIALGQLALVTIASHFVEQFIVWKIILLFNASNLLYKSNSTPESMCYDIFTMALVAVVASYYCSIT